MIKLILADIDGVLIENGMVNSFLKELKDKINELREKGILFSFVSGRDYKFIDKLREKVIEKQIKKNESILYEDVGLKLFSGEEHVLGGVEKRILEKLNSFHKEYQKIFTGLVPLPNNNFQLRYSWVTEEFAQGKDTNLKILEEKYPKIKNLLKSKFPNIEIKKSADAIDVVGKGCDKIISVKKYLEILEDKGISQKDVLIIGDSESDKKMLEYILENGGKAGFVGDNKNLEDNLKNKGAYISKQKGMKGTLEILKNFS
jgi:HAD superfamily hydrolase (TIGR01484 family)